MVKNVQFKVRNITAAKLYTRVAMDTMQCSVQKYWLAASMIVIHREPLPL